MLRQIMQCAQTCNVQLHPPFRPREPSILATNLIKSYFDKGSVEEARMMFDEMHERDVVTWTAMITGYSSCGYYWNAWTMFCEMMRNGVRPNDFTLSGLLKASKGLEDPLRGTIVHGLVVKCGIEGSLYVQNALLDMYATCGVSMENACTVFDQMNVKNNVTWTTLIAGYTHRDDGFPGLQVFREMLREEAEPNPFSFSIAIRACASLGSLNLGKQVHAAVINHGFESNLPVMNSVLDMYFRCGKLIEAKQHFHWMTEKDLITWNTLITGCEKTDPEDSLQIFSQMESEGFSPNCFTFTSVLAACANIPVLICGQQVHAAIASRGLSENTALNNALIDMYAKCGSVPDAYKIFSEMPHINLVTWTSMMIGYGVHGYGNEVIDLFNKMVRSGIVPDRVVFMAVLSACSHSGLVEEGMLYFKTMSDYQIAPDQDIYACVVDLLGRAGKVEEAYSVIKSMPFEPNEDVWCALLGACKAHKLYHIGKLAARKMCKLRPTTVGTYVMLSNIYAGEGKWGECAKLRKLMRLVGVRKETGVSWIEVKNQVHRFAVGDKTSFDRKSVEEVLELLVRHMNKAHYLPEVDKAYNHLLDDL